MLHLFLPFALAASTPGSPDSLAPDRDWDLTHLHLDLNIDLDAESVEGTATLSFEPLLPGSTTLWVHQVGLNIQEVRLNGEPVEFRVFDTSIEVDAKPQDGAATLEIDYQANPQNGLHWRKKGPGSPDRYNEVFSQGENTDNRYWFPSWDYPNDRFTYSGRFEVPEGYRALSNGLGEFDGTAWNYRLEQDLVNYLVMLAVGPYKERTDTWRGRPIRQWYPPHMTEDAVEHISGKVPEMMELFTEKTGAEYPYPIYTEVFVQRFLYAGMENTTATVEEQYLLQPSSEGDLAQGAQSVVAHEAAHHWFGDMLTCKTWHELWLNEGFATYFAAIWERVEFGEANFYQDVLGWYRSSVKAGPMSGRWWSTDDGNHSEYTAVYVRGASTLQMLRVLVGEEAFWKAIQKYVADNAHSLVETDDLRLAFEEVTGQHLGWFFDQWTHLSGAPKVTTTHRYEDGMLRVDVAQEGERSFSFPLDIEVGTSGDPVVHREWVNEGSLRFTISLDEAPKYVAVDPQAGVLATFENNQSVEQWIAQLSSPSPAAKHRAIIALKDKPANTASVEALRAILLNPEEERTYRQGAAKTLGDLDHPIGDDALRKAVFTAKSPSLRSTIAEALGNGQAHGDDARVLARVADRDATREVRGKALQSLAHFDRSSALSKARRVLRSNPGFNIDLHRAAARVIRNHGGLKDLPFLLRHMDREDHDQLASHCLWQSLGLINRLDKDQRAQAREDVAEKVVEWLDSRDLRLQQAGLYGLQSTGSKEDIEEIQSLRARTTLPSLRSRADDAVSKIRERREEPEPEAAEVADELEALTERIEALEKALEEEKSRH